MAFAATSLMGCSTVTPPSPTSPSTAAELPPGMSVELLQQRSDRAPGRLQIRVTNDSAEGIAIDSARLRGGPLSTAIDWARAPATVRAGATLNLPVLLPRLICTADPIPVTVTLGFGDGTSVDVAPADPLAVVDGLATGACAAEDLARSVDVRGTGMEIAGAGAQSTARLVIVLTPTGDGPAVDVVSLAPTVLITSPDGKPWRIDRTVDQSSREPATVTIDLLPRRCDAHVLAENKVGTLFPLHVVVNGEDQTVTLPLDPGVSDEILGFVSTVCGLG